MPHRANITIASELVTALSDVQTAEALVAAADADATLAEARTRLRKLSTEIRESLGSTKCLHLAASNKMLFVDRNKEVRVLDIVEVNR